MRRAHHRNKRKWKVWGTIYHKFVIHLTQISLLPDISYWQTLGSMEIAEAKNTVAATNTKIAKNIAIFIGDGMSIPTVAASRIFKAQHNNSPNPESELLTFETLSHFGHSKVRPLKFVSMNMATKQSSLPDL